MGHKPESRRERLAQPRPDDISPQPGPQSEFLQNSADICVFGGAAGGSKTFSLLLEATRNIHLPTYSAVLFRRTHPEIIQPGGMWPESMRIYPYLGGKPNGTELSWKFPSGAVIKFGHLQYAWDVRKWLGSQVALIGFDQLEVFEAEQFWYMLSRNRSMCGIRPYIRGTANPQPGWLADLLAWWIDPATGYPIKERSGVLRWFVRIGDNLKWAENPDQLRNDHPGSLPKSLTFIPAKLTDNKILMEADPGYMANLEALPLIERQRLKDGNWLISNAENEWPSSYFDKVLFDEWPPDVASYLRVMALDPSKGSPDGTGDYSAWTMLAIDRATLTCWFDADLNNTRPVEPLASMPGMRSIVTDGIEIFRKFKPCAVLVEITGGQQLVADAILRVSRNVGCPMPLHTTNDNTPKPVRIITGLDTLFAQRRIRIKNTPGGRMLLQQCRDFKRDQKPSSGIHDDGPDSAAMAIAMANEVLYGENSGSSAIHVLQA